MSSSIPPQNEFSQGVVDGDNRYARARTGADELLPPVEPPSAGFIIQLFVIPAVIVAAVVALWFVIESLARRGEQDPAVIVAALKANNQARFQQAKELADMLRLPQRYPEMKVSHELAQQIATYVDELVAAGRPEDAEVTMRIFLVTALGEFHVADGMPALVNAALHDPQRDVRRRAINAIAVLSASMAALKPPQPLNSDELNAALLQLADDQDELIRSETAFALGVVAAAPEADAQLADKLVELADDPYTDARFNAAAALARLGDPAAPAAVAEMFDPESLTSSLSGEKALTTEVTEEALAAQKAFKRNMILSSALKSTNLLLATPALPAASFVPLESALEGFLGSREELQKSETLPDELVAEAERTLTRVKARAAGN
ncbi:MAG: HEAT repeat domain-containing protein [Planctomycetaceae bacterium]|nr:HEAT repeat domain-containing protein [Planctomycetaceae bacterium]